MTPDQEQYIDQKILTNTELHSLVDNLLMLCANAADCNSTLSQRQTRNQRAMQVQLVGILLEQGLANINDIYNSMLERIADITSYLQTNKHAIAARLRYLTSTVYGAEYFERRGHQHRRRHDSEPAPTMAAPSSVPFATPFMPSAPRVRARVSSARVIQALSQDSTEAHARLINKFEYLGMQIRRQKRHNQVDQEHLTNLRAQLYALLHPEAETGVLTESDILVDRDEELELIGPKRRRLIQHQEVAASRSPELSIYELRQQLIDLIVAKRIALSLLRSEDQRIIDQIDRLGQELARLQDEVSFEQDASPVESEHDAARAVEANMPAIVTTTTTVRAADLPAARDDEGSMNLPPSLVDDPDVDRYRASSIDNMIQTTTTTTASSQVSYHRASSTLYSPAPSMPRQPHHELTRAQQDLHSTIETIMQEATYSTRHLSLADKQRISRAIRFSNQDNMPFDLSQLREFVRSKVALLRKNLIMVREVMECVEAACEIYHVPTQRHAR